MAFHAVNTLIAFAALRRLMLHAGGNAFCHAVIQILRLVCIFFRQKAAQIAHVKWFFLFQMKRFQRIHQVILHFFRSIQRNIFKFHRSRAVNVIQIRFRINKTRIRPCDDILTRRMVIKIRLAVKEPERHIYARNLFQPLLRGIALRKQPFSLAKLQKRLSCVLLIRLKRQNRRGAVFPLQLCRQNRRVAAENTEGCRRYIIRHNLAAAGGAVIRAQMAHIFVRLSNIFLIMIGNLRRIFRSLGSGLDFIIILLRLGPSLLQLLSGKFAAAVIADPFLLLPIIAQIRHAVGAKVGQCCLFHFSFTSLRIPVIVYALVSAPPDSLP